MPGEGDAGSADARRAAAMRTSGVSAPAGGAPSDAALLATVMRRLAAVRDSRAEFTEEKTIAALRAPLRSSGRLAYRRPDRLEKITEWPQVEVLAVHGGTLSLTDNGATRTIVLASEPAIGALVEAILGTLAGDLAGLRRWYHVGATGTPAAWRLSLRPRTPALAKFIRAAVIDGAGARMTRLRMVEANGDTSVMTISPA
ncbi:MAG: outer membrane lipoprotein carrier protein LolA [Proteobacteria bacterium]|nr:outer membrane lipoprotein carrier protein LolA [Pseudomonadota bacterium]